jgi:hypothetical protein
MDVTPARARDEATAPETREEAQVDGPVPRRTAKQQNGNPGWKKRLTQPGVRPFPSRTRG